METITPVLFPIFSDANQGLERIASLSYEEKINAFKEKVGTIQPPFLIKKESWKLLSEGKQHDSADSWIPTGFEIYAFAFCIAFAKNQSLNHKPGAYFRIRTILKKVDEVIKPGKKNIRSFVEVKKIAYVSLNTALENLDNPDRPQQNCLKFIDESDLRGYRNIVDGEVIHISSSEISEISNIPKGFIKKQKSIIKNEGAIFGKNRIWNQLLSKRDLSGTGGKYNFEKDTLIFLAWNEEKKMISFDFKINDEYNTSIECPFPPVCT